MISKLKEARKRFAEIRNFDDRINVRWHAWQDHRNRGFTPMEIIRLVRGQGTLSLNCYPSAQANSFLWRCKDEAHRDAEIAIVFERRERDELIVMIHAYREVKK